MFAIGYLLACFLGAALMLGGFGAALASVRVGKAELLARVILAGFSGIAIVAALVLGIGVNPAFGDAVLRRYPLSTADRFLTRRLTALLDPLWMILLALFLGLAAGFHAVGAGSLWLGAPAALLLVIATHLFAQLLGGIIGWMDARPAGSLVTILTLVCAASAAPSIGASPGLSAALLPLLKITPAFCAATLMAGGSALCLWLLLAWCLGTAAAIAAVERLPMPTRKVAGAPPEWDGPCDRVAVHFGVAAPLVAKTLKYYWRTKRARLGLLLNLPALPLMLLAMQPDRHAPLLHFFIGVGLMATVGFSATFSMAINAFGFDGSGFRRYFLLPLPPRAVVTAVSLVPLLLGALTLPLAFAVCMLLARTPVDGRMAAILAANGVGGLCFFQGLALWTSVLAPSRTDGRVGFGNDYTLAANVAGNGGILVAFFGSQVLGLTAGARALQFWWAAPVFMVLSVCFYIVSFRLAPGVLLSRRERILAVVEHDPQGGRLIT